MKKAISIILICILLIGIATAGIFGSSALSKALGKNVRAGVSLRNLEFPVNSSDYSEALAKQSIALAAGKTSEEAIAIFEKAGLKVLTQKNFDKDPDVPDGTCAYTIGKKKVTIGGDEKTLLVIALRRTQRAEWYSNFDVAPSHAEDTAFAENFLFAAEDVMVGLGGILEPVLTEAAKSLPTSFLTSATTEEIEDAAKDKMVVLVCGHGRAGASAGLLGLILNSTLKEENIYVYTSGSPATIRPEYANPDLEETTDPKKSFAGVSTTNIFNLIYSPDVATHLPLSSWGYLRPGTDIVLTEEDESEEAEAEEFKEIISSYMDEIYPLTQTINDYYTVYYNLGDTSEDSNEKGLSLYDLTVILSEVISQESENQEKLLGMDVSSLISEDSPHAPIADLFTELLKDDGELAGRLITYHQEQTYIDLLD